MKNIEGVDYILVTQKLGQFGLLLSNILIHDMVSSHGQGFCGAYTKDFMYGGCQELMSKLLNHLVEFEGAVLEGDHLVSLRNVKTRRS